MDTRSVTITLPMRDAVGAMVCLGIHDYAEGARAMRTLYRALKAEYSGVASVQVELIRIEGRYGKAWLNTAQPDD